jgi:hypothetical protein
LDAFPAWKHYLPFCNFLSRVLKITVDLVSRVDPKLGYLNRIATIATFPAEFWLGKTVGWLTF